ncbi:hypothetical protein N9262_02230 [Akkermansiaceae bacterium]|nr:hypothetical protein [Akkermansiaceae bacterium]
MTKRDWKHFKYEVADFLFGNQMDEAFREGQRSGVEYTSLKLGFAVRNLDTSKMTKTQKIGHEASMAAIVEAKKEIMRKTGARL